MSEFNPEGRLLLGTQGWLRADWFEGYYPEDLPEDWRLAYYGNDCDAVLLPETAWLAGVDAAHALDDEVPDDLHLFLLGGSAEPAVLRAALQPLPRERTVLLVDQAIPAIDGVRQWIARDPDCWIDPASGAVAQRWRVESMDLRDLRVRAEGLDPRIQALVLDGPGADPGRIADLRTLLQLLGKD